MLIFFFLWGFTKSLFFYIISLMKRRYKFKKENSFKKQPRFDLKPETTRGIWAIGFFALAALIILSLFNLGGVAGQYLIKVFSLSLGRGIFFIPLVFIVSGIILIKTPGIKLSYKGRLLGMGIFTLAVLGLLHSFTEIQNSLVLAQQGKGGGYVGLLVSYPLLKVLSFWGGLVVLFALVIISLLIIFNISLNRFLVREQKESEKETKIEKPKVSEKKDTSVLLPTVLKSSFGLKEKIGLLGKKALSKQDYNDDKQSGQEQPNDDFKKSLSRRNLNWSPPPINLLEKENGSSESGNIKANMEIIKQTLENFGISVEMGEVSIGPTVTQYTLRPESGIKLSRIAALNNDLALALAAHPIRIEAPIPGKSLVGIEIPNRKVAIVRVRAILESDSFKQNKSPLGIALGRDVANNPMVADLDKMPHLLISGSTGSGKSVCINNIIISHLYVNSPDNLKLLLIDPKRVELSIYDGIPHLIAPVVVKPEKTVNALKWCVAEMERRYELLSQIGARDIVSYNSKVLLENDKVIDEEQSTSSLPYIIVIIDELADLMASHGREVEGAIVRLAQMARAVGVHLVVATQRPSTDVITGLIKANITSRIAFRVASQVDSRTILDMAGAEKLLGNGDMLFLGGNNNTKPRRIQGAFVSEKEIKQVVDYLKNNNKIEPAPDLEQDIFQSKNLDINLDNSSSDDELYKEAKETVIRAGKASASLLQRRLRVGYARAARLLDLLEENGVIGPAEGARPRKVFVDEGENVDYKSESELEKEEE